MVRRLARRTYANVQMGGSKQLVTRLQYMHSMGADLGAFTAEIAITASANDILGYLIAISWGHRSYFPGYLVPGHQCLNRVFRQNFFKC
jgi:hypothetical protein